MSRVEHPDENGWPVPVIERIDEDLYGVGRYHWKVIATRAGAHDHSRPIVFTVRTVTCRRTAARHIAQTVLDVRNVQGLHFLTVTLTHTDKELHS